MLKLCIVECPNGVSTTSCFPAGNPAFQMDSYIVNIKCNYKLQIFTVQNSHENCIRNEYEARKSKKVQIKKA